MTKLLHSIRQAAGLTMLAAILTAVPSHVPAQGATPVSIKENEATLFPIPGDTPLAEDLPEVADEKIAKVEVTSDRKSLRIRGLKRGETRATYIVVKDTVTQERAVRVLPITVLANAGAENSAADQLVTAWGDRLKRYGLTIDQTGETIFLEGNYRADDALWVEQFMKDAELRNVRVNNLSTKTASAQKVLKNVEIVTTLYLVSNDDMKSLGFQYDGVTWSATGGASASTDSSGQAQGGVTASTGGRINYQSVFGKAQRLDTQLLRTVEGKKARKQYGGSIYIPLVTANSTGTEKVEFGTILEVTPNLLEEEGLCTLDIRVESSTPLGGGGGQPLRLSKDETDQTVTVRFGEQFMLANTFQRMRSEDVQKVPGVSSVPLIGELFKNKGFVDGRVEALLVVEARMQNPGDSGAPKLSDKQQQMLDESAKQPGFKK